MMLLFVPGVETEHRILLDGQTTILILQQWNSGCTYDLVFEENALPQFRGMERLAMKDVYITITIF